MQIKTTRQNKIKGQKINNQFLGLFSLLEMFLPLLYAVDTDHLSLFRHSSQRFLSSFRIFLRFELHAKDMPPAFFLVILFFVKLQKLTNFVTILVFFCNVAEPYGLRNHPFFAFWNVIELYGLRTNTSL